MADQDNEVTEALRVLLVPVSILLLALVRADWAISAATPRRSSRLTDKMSARSSSDRVPQCDRTASTLSIGGSRTASLLAVVTWDCGPCIAWAESERI